MTRRARERLTPMFHHHYESASPTADPDFPPPLVVDLPSLSGEVLRNLASYLCSSIALRHDLNGIYRHLGARPIIFQVGRAVLSERALWSVLVELEGASQWVSSYVDAALGYRGGELASSTAVDVAQEPIYAYLDRWVRRRVCHDTHLSDETREVLDAFERFLRATDMDHETHQDGYIGVVIEYLWFDRARQADFIVFRLVNGQYSGVLSPSPIPRMLRWPGGTLKRVVDRLLREPNVAWQLHSRLLELCAIVYGTHSAPVLDVLDYVRARVAFESESLSDNQKRELRALRREADIWLDEGRGQKRGRGRDGFSTGFHVYDSARQQWTESADIR